MSTAGARLDTPLAGSLDCEHEAMAHPDALASKSSIFDVRSPILGEPGRSRP